MEVETSGCQTLFKQFDWLSSPARCMAWQGTYEGAFRLKRVDAVVEKRACILEGKEFCGYLASWTE